MFQNLKGLRKSVLLFLSFAWFGCQRVSGPQSVQAVTPALTLDRIVQPFSGPSVVQDFLVLKEYPETVFVTGLSVRVLTEEGSRLTPKEADQLLATATLSWLNPTRHAELLQLPYQPDPQLFILGSGNQEVKLPEGFGLAMRSNEPLKLTAQWMNRNPYLQPSSVRLQATVHFQRGVSLKPLRVRALYGWALSQGKLGFFGLKERPDPKVFGVECLHSPPIRNAPEVRDSLGQVFQTRWPLPPGETVNLVPADAQVQAPTTVIQAAGHSWPGLVEMSLAEVGSSAPLLRLDPAKMQVRPQTPLVLGGDRHYQFRLTHRNESPVTAIGGGTMLLYTEGP